MGNIISGQRTALGRSRARAQEESVDGNQEVVDRRRELGGSRGRRRAEITQARHSGDDAMEDPAWLPRGLRQAVGAPSGSSGARQAHGPSGQWSAMSAVQTV